MTNQTIKTDEGIFPQLLLTRGRITNVLFLTGNELVICIETGGMDYYTSKAIDTNINIRYEGGSNAIYFLNRVISPFVVSNIKNASVNYMDLIGRRFLITFSAYQDKKGFQKLFVQSLIEDSDVIALYKRPESKESNNEK